MRKTTLLFLFAILSAAVSAQTVANFENITLSADSFWDGRFDQQAKGFSSGNAYFTNMWDTSFGGFWADGFACSNKKDTINGTYTNKYSTITGGGYNASANFVIGQQNAIVRLIGNGVGKVVEGFYVTNGTYPYSTMKNGDSFSKKFGGVTGTDPDFFLLHVVGWHNGTLKNDTVKFYLADFRSTDSSADYIVKDWRWVNLTSLGNVDSIKLFMTSSDVGQWGINTPLFYAIDNFTTRDIAAGVAPVKTNLVAAYPNPFSSQVSVAVEVASSIELLDINGSVVLNETTADAGKITLNTTEIAAGIYFIRVSNVYGQSTQKLIRY